MNKEEAENKFKNNVAHPSHYTRGKYEPKDVIRDWGLNFNLGSAVKYICRAGYKDDIVQDLLKARQFIDFEIEAFLVWHPARHSGNTLGHATMETRDDGVYARCSLNDSLDAFSNAIERLGMHPSNLNIKKVIFNDPATIVYWEDGTKTVVKAMDGETFDKEKGLAMAISKKSLGNAGNYYDIFKEWITDESKK